MKEHHGLLHQEPFTLHCIRKYASEGRRRRYTPRRRSASTRRAGLGGLKVRRQLPSPPQRRAVGVSEKTMYGLVLFIKFFNLTLFLSSNCSLQFYVNSLIHLLSNFTILAFTFKKAILQAVLGRKCIFLSFQDIIFMYNLL